MTESRVAVVTGGAYGIGRGIVREFASKGAAVVIADAELSGARLLKEVSGLLADRERLAGMAAAASSLARPDAAREVARELLEAAS